MARTRQKRGRSYRLIGAKLFLDRDAELIAWWESLEPGQASRTLKDMLMAEMERQRRAVSVETRLAAIEQQLGDIRAMLANGIRMEGQGQPAERRLDAAEVEARKANLIKRKW